MSSKSENDRFSVDHILPEFRDYYIALGLFVTTFAQVENALVRLLAGLLKLDQHAANAVLSGVRIDVAKQHIGRLASIGRVPASTQKHLGPALEQLKIITNLRNDILHYGLSINTGTDSTPKLHITNANRILTGEPRITPVSGSILHSATVDLGKIAFILTWTIFREPQRKKTVLDLVVQSRGREPWLYKSPPQARPSGKAGQKPHKESHKPEPRRKSSPGSEG